MNKEFQELPHKHLTSKTEIVKILRDSVTKISLDDAALTILTDFNHTRPFTISATASIEDINQNMIACGVRLLFVVDTQGVLLGLVTFNDIFGEKPLLYVQEHGGSREDITTRDIMTPLDQLQALQFSDVLKARIGDILKTIKNSGRQHLLVVEEMKNGAQVITGLFSSTQMEKQLGIKIDVSPRANTFSELERALAQ